MAYNLSNKDTVRQARCFLRLRIAIPGRVLDELMIFPFLGIDAGIADSQKLRNWVILEGGASPRCVTSDPKMELGIMSSPLPPPQSP